VRIEPNSFVGGFPALTIRKLVRRLNNLQCWNAETVRVILRTEGGTAEAIVRALVDAGLAAAQTEQGMDGYRTTSLAPAFGSATAARPITRQTADRALSQLLERVDQVNGEARFLAGVTKVVVFGSYLRADVDRLSDLDIVACLACPAAQGASAELKVQLGHSGTVTSVAFSPDGRWVRESHALHRCCKIQNRDAAGKR
jgi:predicted nucleotidyltransferase